MNQKIYERKIREYLENISKERIINLFIQVQWERNIAIEQLHELGYELGEKVRKNDTK